jgi:helix-turn-helix protein
VTWAVREKSYSQRRACGLIGLHPKTIRYASKRPGDEELRKRLHEPVLQRRRFGYRRLSLMLERQGIKLNRKKLYRLYKEERLTVRKRGGRKRALGTRAPAASKAKWLRSRSTMVPTRSVPSATVSAPAACASGMDAACRPLRFAVWSMCETFIAPQPCCAGCGVSFCRDDDQDRRREVGQFGKLSFTPKGRL